MAMADRTCTLHQRDHHLLRDEELKQRKMEEQKSDGSRYGHDDGHLNWRFDEWLGLAWDNAP